MLISGFDHVVIAVRDLGAAAHRYETLLGRGPSQRQTRDGVATELIVLDNVAVELMAPAGESDAARRLSAALEDGEGLKSLVFSTPDIERAHRRCERVALQPAPIAVPPASNRQATHAASPEGSAEGPSSSRQGSYRSFRLNTDRTHGVRLFFQHRDEALTPAPRSDAGVLGLDHIVIRSGDMERAAALYGARLGLDMRLDREVRGQRLMFFRCGDAVVEIAHDSARADDALWGLSWRVANADAARQRLVGMGLNVSDVRPGMKPGTRVFTVRDGTCNVPTLMIEQVAGRG